MLMRHSCRVQRGKRAALVGPLVKMVNDEGGSMTMQETIAMDVAYRDAARLNTIDTLAEGQTLADMLEGASLCCAIKTKVTTQV